MSITADSLIPLACSCSTAALLSNCMAHTKTLVPFILVLDADSHVLPCISHLNLLFFSLVAAPPSFCCFLTSASETSFGVIVFGATVLSGAR